MLTFRFVIAAPHVCDQCLSEGLSSCSVLLRSKYQSGKERKKKKSQFDGKRKWGKLVSFAWGQEEASVMVMARPATLIPGLAEPFFRLCMCAVKWRGATGHLLAFCWQPENLPTLS